VLYQTAGWISDPRFSPDGQTIAFADHPVFGDDQGFVSTIQASGGSIQHLTRSFESLQKLAWHPNGQQVWFTAADAGFYYSLYAVDRSQKQRLVLTVPGGVELEDIAPDGKVLLDHYVERTLLMVSTKDHREERDLSWLDNVEFFRFSSDGNQILLGDESEGSGRKHATFIRNVDGSPAVRLGDGDGIVLSPDGKWALSSLPPNQLRLLPPGTGELQVLSHADPAGDPKPGVKRLPKIRADLEAEWFPDGKRIAYIGDDNRTHLLALSGNDTVLTETGTTGYLVAPDGQHVLVQTPAGQYELYPVSGGQPVAVSWLRPQDLPVRFSADGKALFIAAPREGSRGRDLFRVDLSDSHRTLLWHFQAPNNAVSNDAWYVDITPDGTGYAYSYRQKSCTLFVVSGLK
jgi:dipeptidyl aminopeptidase/acylaminoacyl peptidase